MSKFNYGLFKQTPIIGIVRKLTFKQLKAILPYYLESGLNAIEITMNTPGAEEMITYVAKNYQNKLNIGAGTVTNLKELDLALHAGAEFIVMPIVEETVIQECINQEIPVFPGAMTPTEINKAWSLGAAMVKVFPAGSLGNAYIKDIKAPLSHIDMLATGDMNLENMDAFWNAGIRGFGIGSPLFNQSLIANEDWQGLGLHFKQYFDKINMLKSQND